MDKLLHCLSLFFVSLDSYHYLSISHVFSSMGLNISDQVLVIVCKSVTFSTFSSLWCAMFFLLNFGNSAFASLLLTI